jgi:hypothetical protein
LEEYEGIVEMDIDNAEDGESKGQVCNYSWNELEHVNVHQSIHWQIIDDVGFHHVGAIVGHMNQRLDYNP